MIKLLKKIKSTFDTDHATNTISSLIFIGVLVAVLLFVVAVIFGLSVFQNSVVNNTTNLIQSNIFSMVYNFFALLPTIGTILAVVILIAIIVILVLYVKRMKDTGMGGSGFQG